MPSMLVCRRFTFEAAHYIPNHPLCGKTHGHTYTVELKFKVDAKAETIQLDFNEIKYKELWVKQQLDHKLLNDIVSYPSVENIAKWIMLHTNADKVVVYEGLNNWVEYDRNDNVV